MKKRNRQAKHNQRHGKNRMTGTRGIRVRRIILQQHSGVDCGSRVRVSGAGENNG